MQLRSTEIKLMGEYYWHCCSCVPIAKVICWDNWESLEILGKIIELSESRIILRRHHWFDNPHPPLRQYSSVLHRSYVIVHHSFILATDLVYSRKSSRRNRIDRQMVQPVLMADVWFTSWKLWVSSGVSRSIRARIVCVLLFVSVRLSFLVTGPLDVCLFFLLFFLPIFLSMYLSIYLSFFLSFLTIIIHYSLFLSFFLNFFLSFVIS